MATKQELDLLSAELALAVAQGRALSRARRLERLLSAGPLQPQDEDAVQGEVHALAAFADFALRLSEAIARTAASR